MKELVRGFIQGKQSSFHRQSMIKRIQQANKRCLNAGKAFLQLRSTTRIKKKFSLEQAVRKLFKYVDEMFCQVFFLLPLNIWRIYLGKFFVRSNRKNMTIDKSSPYLNRINSLKPLDEQIFHQSNQIVRVKIEHLNPQ